jgi:hypothetical protein
MGKEVVPIIRKGKKFANQAEGGECNSALIPSAQH